MPGDVKRKPHARCRLAHTIFGTRLLWVPGDWPEDSRKFTGSMRWYMSCISQAALAVDGLTRLGMPTWLTKVQRMGTIWAELMKRRLALRAKMPLHRRLVSRIRRGPKRNRLPPARGSRRWHGAVMQPR